MKKNCSIGIGQMALESQNNHVHYIENNGFKLKIEIYPQEIRLYHQPIDTAGKPDTTWKQLGGKFAKDCHGCLYELANQAGHMHPGGCLSEDDYYWIQDACKDLRQAWSIDQVQLVKILKNHIKRARMPR